MLWEGNEDGVDREKGKSSPETIWDLLCPSTMLIVSSGLAQDHPSV